MRTPEDLRFQCYLLAGLYELEARGEARVRVVVDFSMPEHGLCVMRWDVVERASGRRRVVVFDTRDHPGLFVEHHLAVADLYFKRSFEPAAIAAEVPPEQRAKLQPLGLYFPTRSVHAHDRLALAAGYLGHAVRLASRSRLRLSRPQSFYRELVAPLRQRLHWLRFVARLPSVDRFEPHADDAPREPYTLFLTRIFPAYEHDVPAIVRSKMDVNDQRAELIRHLRRELGARFVGGVADEPYARAHYGDVIAPTSTARGDFLAQLQRASVVVYTRGLVGSAGWKLAESFAAGCAVVMEPLPGLLPAPLVDGVHALFARTPDEFLAHCRALLDDPARARALGRAAAQYYRDWVQPETNVRRMLALAFAA